VQQLENTQIFPVQFSFPDQENEPILERRAPKRRNDRWRNMLSEAEMRKQFAYGYCFPPLQIRLGPKDALLQKNDELDAILAVTAEEQTFEFAAEFKSRNTPRIFEEALNVIQKAAQRRQMLPMLVVPYLRENQLEELQRRQLSGIDLSGNGVVTVPGKLLVYRTGAPNKFPESAPTKYAYRGTTSLVARAFLCRETFRSLADIEGEIKKRGGSVVLSTISKALKRMTEDLIIDRADDGFRLRQPEKLLQKLNASYSPPKVGKIVTLKVKKVPVVSEGRQLTADGLKSVAKLTLDRLFLRKDLMTLAGVSSIENYAVMGRQEWPVLYTPNAGELLRIWGENVEQTSRFVDLELRETDDPTVYFDVRMKENLPYASPIQVFLECSAGDKREQETALQVKNLILRELKE
jgi:hypothetical protein